MRWYAMHVKTGEELNVRGQLQKEGFAAKVPVERRAIHQKGKWSEKDYVLMPGYVFLGSEKFGSKEFYTAKKCEGFLKFLGQPQPQPLSHLEAEYICVLAPSNEPLVPSVVEDGVVVSGVLLSIPGKVVKLDVRQRRAKAELSVMGEVKTVEFSISVPDELESKGDEDEEKTET